MRFATTRSVLSSVPSRWTRPFRIALDKRGRRLVLFTLGLVFVTSIAAGLTPVLLKALIDALDTDPTSTTDLVWLLAVLYPCAHWLTKSFGLLREAVHSQAEQHAQKLLAGELFRHVVSLPLRFHLELPPGTITQTLNNGLFGFRMVLHHFMLTLVPVAIELMTMTVVLCLVGQRVFLLVVGVAVAVNSLAFWNGIAHIAQPARAVASSRIEANTILTDSLLNCETIKCFNAEATACLRFGQALRTTEEAWKLLYARKIRNSLVVSGVFALALAASVYFASRQVLQNSMTIGEFVLMNAYLLQLMQPLERVGLAIRDIAESRAWIAKMTELLDYPREWDSQNPWLPLIPCNPKVEFERVSFTYGTGSEVVKDVSFTVAPGTTVAIVGASGSGKSSLVRLLARLIEPTTGQILIDGVPLSRIPIAEVRRALAIVPQEIGLLDASIAYNIGIGRPGCTNAEIAQAARTACLHTWLSRLPEGLETKVGNRGMRLSGGEKQRIAIARAVLKRPKILVLDEMTSSLDGSTEQAILQNIRSAASTVTTLVIAHRVSTIIDADEIVVMHNGRIVERGKHNDLLRFDGAYAAMWRTNSGSHVTSPDAAEQNQSASGTC